MDQREGLTVIDVRTAHEFSNIHIRGSYNVPLAMLAEHAEEIADRVGEHVVLVCQSGVRAVQAQQKLAPLGISTVAVLEGGVNGFAAAGGDVVRGSQVWDIERQVRFTAGSLVLASLLGGKFLSPKMVSLAGGIGAGLTVSALTNTCAMGKALSALPWNRTRPVPTKEETFSTLPDQKK
nr:rhodanese-like domain-containing protein [Corynebacterium deserti]